MRRTIFNTPGIAQLLRGICWLGLKLTGWKVEGQAPAIGKYVLIAVPHTSNWDFPVTLAIAFRLRIKLFWMGKASLFRGPMGPIMRWLGGVPVERSKSHGLVQQLVQEFDRCRELVVAISPEGTRSKVQQWKSGFYHVAVGAGVPIALGYLDFRRKVGGVGSLFRPTGDYQADLVKLKAFYQGVTGKRVQQ